MFEKFTSSSPLPLPSSYFIIQQLVDAGQTSSPSPQIREQDEMEQDEMEQDEEDEDTDEDDDGVLFGSLDKARNVSIDLMKQLKDEFGSDVVKKLVIESAKAVDIALHGNRDTSITIDVPLGDMRLQLNDDVDFGPDDFEVVSEPTLSTFDIDMQARQKVQRQQSTTKAFATIRALKKQTKATQGQASKSSQVPSVPQSPVPQATFKSSESSQSSKGQP
ncbi:hypothetical protein MAM1_0251c08748 [Mucor ambiguus]|uniref:Uncharacterized protein n=1 Tax=Mucor ambiguus TaxID=91626 RepID=A0A0C9LWW3_9FUNG|nr:hypothetical protein MAM1_0251c08748 [Mucor ambiguus]